MIRTSKVVLAVLFCSGAFVQAAPLKKKLAQAAAEHQGDQNMATTTASSGGSGGVTSSGGSGGSASGGENYKWGNIYVNQGGMQGGDLSHYFDMDNDSWKPAMIDIELPSLPECDCNLTALPNLGAGVNTGFSAEAQALQSSLLTEVPDT